MLPQGAQGPGSGEQGQQQQGLQQGEREEAPCHVCRCEHTIQPHAGTTASPGKPRPARRPCLAVAGAAAPFIVAQQAPQIVLTSGGQPVVPLAGSGGSGLPLAGSGGSGISLPGSGGSGIPLGASGGSGIDPALLQQYFAGLAALAGSGGSGIPLAGSGGSGIPLAGALSLPEQQFILAGAGGWPDAGACGLVGGSMSLPLMPGGGYGGGGGAAAAAAAKGPRGRKSRPYKHPNQVQEEKKKKAEVQVRARCASLFQRVRRVATHWRLWPATAAVVRCWPAGAVPSPQPRVGAAASQKSSWQARAGDACSTVLAQVWPSALLTAPGGVPPTLPAGLLPAAGAAAGPGAGGAGEAAAGGMGTSFWGLGLPNFAAG